MIGVKRPLKLNAPRPSKSTKKKKALQSEVPLPDPDDATVVANPYAEYMNQQPSELMQTEVLEEGQAPNVFLEEAKALEDPKSLPHLMWFRHQELMRRCGPKDWVEGQRPSLSWLEERYGHLVEKPFWYDRVVKLSMACKDKDPLMDLSDMTRGQLETEIGAEVPFTSEEEEYQSLLEKYRQSPVQIDGHPDLAYLRRHFADPTLQDLACSSEEEEEDLIQRALNEARYVPSYVCPVHDERDMKCLNPDAVSGAFFFKCSLQDCPVFFTESTREAVCHQLQAQVHPSVHARLVHGDLKCHCHFTPRMKLSRTQKNPGRVFLTCFKRDRPCAYFQWVHWKIRDPAGPIDAFLKTLPTEADRQRQVLEKTRRSSPPPPGPLRRVSTQQLVKTGLARFERDQVKELGGFRPTPGYQGHDFVRGVYRPEHPLSVNSGFLYGPEPMYCSPPSLDVTSGLF